ncbi:MAG: MoaD/ThiS family protein [Promethearchaeia archaeon]
MINLKLHYESPFDRVAKSHHETLKVEDGITLRELFNYLSEKYGEDFEELLYDDKNPDDLNNFLCIIINGRTFRDENFLDRKLKEGDDISLFYGYFGG